MRLIESGSDVPDTVRAPSVREFIRVFRQRWFVAMAGAIGVIAWFVSAIFPAIAAPKIVQLAALCGVILAAYYVWAQEREKRLEALAFRTDGAAPNEWSVDFFGQLADIRVLDATESRYAVALDVVITNRSAKPLSLSAELLIQWARIRS